MRNPEAPTIINDHEVVQRNDKIYPIYHFKGKNYIRLYQDDYTLVSDLHLVGNYYIVEK